MLDSRSQRLFVSPAAILFIAICTIALPAVATDHYVRPAPGPYGSADGSDWNNACADFRGACAISSLTRGDTYYVSAGTYSGETWNRPASGTAAISIIRATATNAGTAPGWSSSFDGTVRWGEHDFTSPYWIFDGVTPGSSWAPPGTGASSADYGFFINHASNCNSTDATISINNTHDITVKNTAIIMCNASFDQAKWCVLASVDSSPANNVLLSHMYCQFAVDFWQSNGSAGESNDTFEYIYSVNNGGTASNHGEVYQLVCNNCTIRYNWFQDCSSTSCISGNAGTAPGAPNLIPMYNTQIYGNIFNNVDAGNGVIHAAGSTGMSGTRFYNNTIVKQTTGPFFDECSGHNCPSGSGNNIVENNLIWSGNCNLGQFGLSGDVHDYNTFLSCIGSAPSEGHGQTGSFNPFVNSSGLNFHLASISSLSPGLTLPSPYNFDLEGASRGASGTWARGAYEFGGQSSSTPPAPPTFLSAIVQ